jgi:multidrug efflux system membrane fusion protein
LREQVKRYAELVEKQYVSREQYDQIRTNADAMEAVVDADRAALENARVQLSYCYIYSPVNGRVGSLLINEGNLVRVNDGAPLVVINQVSPMNVTFSVPESHLADLKRHMARGQLRVAASFPSDEGRPEMGVLEFVDNTVDRSTGTIKLKAVFTNNERRLWPGQFINVALTLTTQPDAVVVPSEAVQVGPEGQHVFVVKPDESVEVRPVTLGSTSEGEAVIAKGLMPGEQIVREGQFLLGPGSRIEVKNPTNTAEETKGEGKRRQDGGGRAKADGASGDVEVKGEGRAEGRGSDRAITAGAVKESAKGADEGKGERAPRRKGRGQSKAEG